MDCPLKGHCLTNNVLYEATINANIPNYSRKVYKGVTCPIFKLRFKNHEKAFNHIKYKNDCELSKEVWKIKEGGGTYSINWRIIKQYRDYNPASKKCALCLNEKYEILIYDGDNQLNKRSEIISTCRHRRKYLLAYATSNRKEDIV